MKLNRGHGEHRRVEMREVICVSLRKLSLTSLHFSFSNFLNTADDNREREKRVGLTFIILDVM